MFSPLHNLTNRSKFVYCRTKFAFVEFGVRCALNSEQRVEDTKNSAKRMPVHLSQGAPEPPLSPGKLRLYGMRFCPYDQRVHLVLIAKKIPHDNVWINLSKKPDWYVKQIPTTKVPGMIVDGQALYESLIIADFLDEKYPERPLHSKDPLQKAKDRLLIEGFSKVTLMFFKLVKSPEIQSEDVDTFLSELLEFDKELAERGTTFFAGGKPGMVDYMIWPWFERFSAGKLVFGDKYDFPGSKLKHLVPWMHAMSEDEVVKEYIVSPEVHAKFMKSFAAGAPEFDIPIN